MRPRRKRLSCPRSPAIVVVLILRTAPGVETSPIAILSVDGWNHGFSRTQGSLVEVSLIHRSFCQQRWERGPGTVWPCLNVATWWSDLLQINRVFACKSTVLFSHPNRTPGRVRSNGVQKQMVSLRSTGHSDFYTHTMVRVRHSFGLFFGPSLGGREAESTHRHSLSARPRRGGAAVGKPQSSFARREAPPWSIHASMIVKWTAEASPIAIYPPKTPASIPSDSAIPAPRPTSQCQCSGTACLQVNPCSVESDCFRKSIHH
jgi:hypothetical protein